MTRLRFASARQVNTKTRLVWFVLVVAILLPRVALLLNGLDSQRIWDTNTPSAFRFLQAVQENKLPEFFKADQKYPLLGAYLYVPVVGAYYATGRAFQWFKSANDFVNVFAVGGTRLFFWIRAEALIFNIFGISLLFFLVKRFSNGSLRAGIYALLLAATDFYLTMFSVTPRIHNFAFVGAVMVLYASFLLLEEKTLKNYLLAFGAAGVAASLSQSGFTTFVLPALAHILSNNEKKLRARHHIKEFALGLSLFLFFALFIGYPRFFPALLSRGDILSVFLSGEHSQPSFGIRNLFIFLREYIFGAAWAASFALFAGFWYAFCARRKDRIRLSNYDWLAIAHIFAFVLLFGFSNVMSWRFMLAILPSLIFLCARFANMLESRKGFTYMFASLMVAQAFGIGLLTMVAAGGDTRSQASAYVLSNTNENDKLLATLDTELLGIVPAPHSVSENDSGILAKLIKNRDLRGVKTRQIERWYPEKNELQEEKLVDYKYVVVSSDGPDRYIAENILLRNGFRPKAAFYATRKQDPLWKSFIAWDMIAPMPRVPYPFNLRAFRAFGPTIVVYGKI